MGIIIKKYIWVLSLLLVLIMSYLMARMVSLFIAGYFPDEVFSSNANDSTVSVFDGGQKKISVDDIISRNFFDATESSFENANITIEDTPPDENLENDKPVDNNGVAVKTSLSLTLVSTVSFGNGEDSLSSCVVEAERKSEVYAVGEALSFPQTKIVRILPKRIEFTNKGRLEYAEIPEEAINPKSLDSPSDKSSSRITSRTSTKTDEDEAPVDEEGIKQTGNHFIVKNAVVQSALQRPELLVRQARALPHFESGKPAGFQFSKVSTRSLFHQLGIRKGDIVKSVNGRILDMQSGMKTFAELKDMKNFEMAIVRKGTEETFTYEVVD